jgi:hypothetical protein
MTHDETRRAKTKHESCMATRDLARGRRAHDPHARHAQTTGGDTRKTARERRANQHATTRGTAHSTDDK